MRHGVAITQQELHWWIKGLWWCTPQRKTVRKSATDGIAIMLQLNGKQLHFFKDITVTVLKVRQLLQKTLKFTLDFANDSV